MVRFKVEWSLEARLDLLTFLSFTLKETVIRFIAGNCMLLLIRLLNYWQVILIWEKRQMIPQLECLLREITK